MDFTNARIPTPVEEPMERRASFREISGETWNILQDCCQVIGAISQSMIGDTDQRGNPPEIKCFRDSLVCTMETARYINDKLGQIAEAIGV